MEKKKKQREMIMELKKAAAGPRGRGGRGRGWGGGGLGGGHYNHGGNYGGNHGGNYGGGWSADTGGGGWNPPPIDPNEQHRQETLERARMRQRNSSMVRVRTAIWCTKHNTLYTLFRRRLMVEVMRAMTSIPLLAPQDLLWVVHHQT